jgi:hypothetical protein
VPRRRLLLCEGIVTPSRFSRPFLLEQLQQLKPENADQPARQADRYVIGMQSREVKEAA